MRIGEIQVAGAWGLPTKIISFEFAARVLSEICQSGVWTKQGSAGGASAEPLYLERNGGSFNPPANCPPGWTQIMYGSLAAGTTSNNRRTCLSPADQTCSVLYLEVRWNQGAPAACPGGWTEVDYQDIRAGQDTNMRRSCIKCL